MKKDKKKTKTASKSTSSQKSGGTSSKVKITPLADRVLVRPFTEEEAAGNNSFGIIIPDTVSKEKSGRGEVVAVGEGKYEDGVLVPVRVKVGDIVFFSKYSYDEVESGGEEYYLLKEDNILAVVK